MDLHSVWSRMWTLQSLGAAAEMGELIFKIDSFELSLHSLNNKGPSKPRVPPQQTRPFNHNPCQFQNDRRSGQSSSKNPNNYHSNRYQGNRRGQEKLKIVKEGDFMHFMPALMLDTPE